MDVMRQAMVSVSRICAVGMRIIASTPGFFCVCSASFPDFSWFRSLALLLPGGGPVLLLGAGSLDDAAGLSHSKRTECLTSSAMSGLAFANASSPWFRQAALQYELWLRVYVEFLLPSSGHRLSVPFSLVPLQR